MAECHNHSVNKKEYAMIQTNTIGSILREYRQKQAETIPDLVPEMIEHYQQQSTRKQQIQDIVDVYVNKYTCAAMAERLADEERECHEANLWIKAQISANGITDQELYEALCKSEQDAKEKGTACFYDLDIKYDALDGMYEECGVESQDFKQLV